MKPTSINQKNTWFWKIILRAFCFLDVWGFNPTLEFQLCIFRSIIMQLKPNVNKTKKKQNILFVYCRSHFYLFTVYLIDMGKSNMEIPMVWST